ncbi:MAG: prepilin-type N-terminal cleavage/methylation domain-containing protein [Syntrophorhabdaceae bacterium]|nr:prepilin-type N-terminal cleavage/methylation domain-containing protein [Syntrophorhabdaceae bacterium]
MKHDRLRTLIRYKLTSAPNAERRTPNSPPNHELRITSCEGFTLLELIIVMFLATLILGLTTLVFSNTLPAARFEATGRELSATIRYMKSLAQNKGEDQALTIDLDTRQYGIAGRNMKTIPAGISIKVSDPVSGEILKGKYTMFFHAFGGVEGGTVILQFRKKTLYIQTDPVAGSVVMRQ